MARMGYQGRGSCRPRWIPRNHAEICAASRGRRGLVAAGLAVLICLALPPWGWGQAAAEQDVHVKPRPPASEPAAVQRVAPGGGVDPSLSMRTKPIRKDVDLVLVNVTVTDP